jgi:hypothetical protein
MTNDQIPMTNSDSMVGHCSLVIRHSLRPLRGLLKNSFSPRLLKKAQVQGGARWAE